ncbi:ABC transporter ATP-binding protein [Nocardia inohanensis]|uniref:ABC transporter ATP-binding protein n=1 Tax=Nocardia inohanensis TaxID=209246 RepID=UPI00082A02AC|nr:ABC transporter ATP-binding protein [Nocardia inohanensis]
MDVRLQHVDISIGRNRICADVSLSAPAGSMIGILGPNGSGKSTLLRGIYRALRPAAGTIVIGGDDVWSELSTRQAAQRTAALIQHGDTDLELTVSQVVALGLTALPRAARTADAVPAALRSMGLADKADSRFRELSGGEKQRVHLARVLAQRPRVLVLDEPTNHLDIRHQLDLLDAVRALGITVVAVLHDLNLAAGYCDQLYLMRGGEVVASGAPGAVLTPATVAEVFQVAAEMGTNPLTGRPHLFTSSLSLRERER